jgi:spermidine/putrescine transport system substrate-binding protein
VEARWADSCGDFGMPYAWGTVGIVYRRDRVAQAPASWRDLLDPAPEHRGHIVMHEDSMDTLIPPLLALGYDINSDDRDALRESFEWLQRQLTHVLSYDYVLTYAKNPERRAQVNMALAYSGDQDTLNDLDGEDTWGYVVPREGTGVWMDCVSVMAGSTRKEAAYRLVNYLAEPLSAARFVEEVAVATPNASGRAMLDGLLRDDPAIFPAGDILAASSTYRMPSEHAMILRNRIVKSLVRAHEAQ